MAPIDVTGATGQKPSRAGRSSTSPFKQQEATVESRDFQRQTLVRSPASSGAGAFAGAFASFFNTIISDQQIREAAQIKEENRQEAMRISAAVNADREGARNAMLTGNLAGFVTPELRDRRAVAESFESIAAQAMAEDDFQNDLKAQIQELPATADPELFLEAYMKEQMDGGSPTFSHSYGLTLRKAASKEIVNLRAGRVIVAEKRAEQAATAAITLDLQNQEAPVSPEALEAMTLRIVASLPASNGAKRVLTAESIRDKAIISEAAQNGGYALKLLALPNPTRSGTSIADRSPGAYEKARAASLTKFKATMSLGAQASYDAVENDLASYLATGQGDLGELYIQMQQAGQKYGKHAVEWQGLRDKFTKAMAGTAVNRGVLKSIAMGNASNVGNNVYAKIAPLLRQPATWEAVAAQTGLPVEAIRSRMLREFGVRGPGKAGREAQSATLLTGADHAQVQALFEESELFISTRSVRMDDKATGHYTREGFALLQMMHLAKASGMDPYAERQKFLDRLEKAGGKLKITGNYKNRFDTSDSKGAKVGPEGEAKMVKDVWENLDLPDARAIHKTKTSVRNAVIEAVDMASAVTEGQGRVGDDHILELASKLLANNFVLERGADGDRRYTFDMTPPMVLDKDNNLVRGDKMDEAALDRLDKSFELPENEALAEFLGGGMGASVDKHTQAGFGLSVVSNTKGFEEEVRFQAGKRFGVDFQNIPEDFPTALISMIQADEGADADPTGTMTFETPPAPQGGEPITRRLSDNLFLLYERSTDQWVMRWKDAGAPSTNPAEVSARNKARRAEMTAARPKATHPQFRETIEGIKGTPSELREDIAGFAVNPPVQGTTGPIGSNVPDESTENQPVFQEQQSVEELHDEIVEHLKDMNFVGEVAVSDERKTHGASVDGATMEDRLQGVVDQEQANGGPLNTISDPQSGSFDNTLMKFVTNEEGYSAFQYDDYSRGATQWTAKSKGNPTIGYGFNLHRPDARILLKRVGLDFDKVMARKQQVTRIQAERLYKMAMAPMVTLVRKKYAEANLGNHQIQALASLAYNSRWNDSGPTLLGPKLSAAIAAKDWVAAGFEIAQNSENVPDAVRRGIHLRRIKEAILFLGPSLAKQVTYLN